MPFTTAYIARSPDADPARHRCVVETGLSTLHTVDAGQTINRILGMFSNEEETQIRIRLADTVR